MHIDEVYCLPLFAGKFHFSAPPGRHAILYGMKGSRHYSETVRRAVENPGTLEQVGDMWIPTDMEDWAIKPLFPENIRQLPDDTPLRLFDETARMPRHHVTTRDAGEIPGIYQEMATAASDIYGLDKTTQQRWVDSAESQAVHEEQHTEGLRGSALYSVTFSANLEAGVVDIGPAVLPIGEYTKLETACQLVHPAKLSLGDINNYEAFGYESVEQVAELAVRYGLPVPLSYQPPTEL
jgi:hypothetical protein